MTAQEVKTLGDILETLGMATKNNTKRKRKDKRKKNAVPKWSTYRDIPIMIHSVEKWRSRELGGYITNITATFVTKGRLVHKLLWARWFLIGFVVRLSLAIIVTLVIMNNHEAAMLYLIDLPAVLFLSIVERLMSTALAGKLTGSHPYYISLNLLASFLWGLIFMIAAIGARAVLFKKRSK